MSLTAGSAYFIYQLIYLRNTFDFTTLHHNFILLLIKRQKVKLKNNGLQFYNIKDTRLNLAIDDIYLNQLIRFDKKWDRCNCFVMDFVNKLPPEVCQDIFSWLPAAELGKCLRVSKQWRSVANVDILWKQHCINFGVNDKNCEMGSSDLCHWGLVWNSFSKTLAYKWHSNTYRKIDLFKNEYESFASYGNHIAVFSRTYNNVDVYTIKKNTNRARLLFSLALCLPSDGTALLAMDSNYIAVGKFNVILLFKRNGCIYELSDAFAVLFSTVIHTIQDFPQFVNQNLNFGSAIEIDVFSKNVLWMSDFDNTYAIDLATNHVTNVFIYESSRLEGDLFVTWSESCIILYNILSNNDAILENIEDIEDVSANMKFLSLIRGYSKDFCVVEVYDLDSSQQLLNKEMPIYTWIKMHPKEEILYTLEASADENVFRIAAWNIRTGAQQWVFQSDNNNGFISNFELHVVCEQYLVIWPTSSDGKMFYLFDSKTGNCIYEKSRPSGSINFISDSFWISWPQKDKSTAIRSFI